MPMTRCVSSSLLFIYFQPCHCFPLRKYIITSKQTQVPLSVPWDQSNQVLPFHVANRSSPSALCSLHVKQLCSNVNLGFFAPQMYLSYNNVSALKLMAAKNNWVLTSEKNKVSDV